MNFALLVQNGLKPDESQVVKTCHEMIVKSLKLEDKFYQTQNIAAVNVRYMKRALPYFKCGGYLEKMKYLAERNDPDF